MNVRPIKRKISSGFSAARRGFTLIEVLLAMTIFGLLMVAVTSQLIESVAISLKSTSALEHSRNTRELIDEMRDDITNAQVMVLYPQFNDRSAKKSDGQLGNYLVLHRLTPTGVVTRTVGYYVVSDGGTGWILYRHDSADGTITAGTLPDASTMGSHEVVIRAVDLPASNNIFRNVRNRAVALRGEFGTGNEAANGRTEFIHFILTTRS